MDPEPRIAQALLEALGDGTLVAVFARLIVDLVDEFVWKMLLAHHAERIVVRVLVPLAMAEPLRTRVVRVAQRRRHPTELAGPHI